ncbi:MAG: hypothetical protein ACTHOO_01830 [Alcanivorax sp.]
MNDDLDEEIIGAEDGFDEFAQKSGLGDTIRQSPVAKIGIVVGAIAVIGFVAVFFSGTEEEDNISMMPVGSQVTSAPGTDEEVSPAYVEAVEQQNEADLDEAIATGGSAIPVPIETPDTRLEVPEIEEETEDPLHRWRLLQEERVERQMQSRESDPEPVTVLDAEQQSEAITALAESMAQQMESVLTTTNQAKTFTVKTLIDYKQEDGSAAGSSGSGGGSTGGGEGSLSTGFEEVENVEIIIPAGKIVYGQMLLEANSDVPFTVLAQMVSGPLKGWKLLGEFEVLDGVEMLGISFEMAVNEEGKQYDVEAYMLDPDSGLAALRTDIDHRYLKRVIFPAAAEFVSGYASAIAESGRTSVTVRGETVTTAENPTTDEQEVATGVEEAADEISSILDEIGDVEVKIVIEAGTPIGVFFTQNVEETEEDI